MSRCHVCGKAEACEERVHEVFGVEGRPIRVENVPATVCTNYGEPVFSRDTTEKVRQMVHGQAKPMRSVQMDVFAFS